MSKRKGFVLLFAVTAIIAGHAIYRQFDFNYLAFKNPLLAGLYLLTFFLSIYLLARNAKEK